MKRERGRRGSGIYSVKKYLVSAARCDVVDDDDDDDEVYCHLRILAFVSCTVVREWVYARIAR